MSRLGWRQRTFCRRRWMAHSSGRLCIGMTWAFTWSEHWIGVGSSLPYKSDVRLVVDVSIKWQTSLAW